MQGVQFVTKVLTCCLISFAFLSPLSASEELDDNEALKQRLKQLEEKVRALEKNKPEKDDSVQFLIEEQQEENRLKIDGFFTVAVATIDRSPNFITLESDSVIEDTPTFSTDTVAALQFTFSLDERTSYTHQLLYRASDKERNFNTEWAFLSHWLTPDFTLRAGRLRSFAYMLSDTLEVGFTYPWVRPPMEIYRIPLTGHEGFDIRYYFSFGEWFADFHFGYGRGEDDIGGGLGASLEVSRLYSSALSFNNGNFQLRTAYLFGKGNIEVDADSPFKGFVDQLIQLGVNNLISFESVDFWYMNMGVRYDDGANTIIAEVSDLDINGFVSPIGRGGYVLYGRRIGNWFPFMTWGKVDNHPDNAPLSETIFNLIALIDVAAATQAQSEFDKVLNNKFHSYTLGINYFVGEHTKLKFDVVHYEGFDNGVAIFTDRPNSHNAVYSMAVDSVF